MYSQCLNFHIYFKSSSPFLAYLHSHKHDFHIDFYFGWISTGISWSGFLHGAALKCCSFQHPDVKLSFYYYSLQMSPSLVHNLHFL